MQWHLLVLAVWFWSVGCTPSSTETAPLEPPGFPGFKKPEPIDSSIPMVKLQSATKPGESRKSKPFSCIGGPLNFQWTTSVDAKSPRALIVVAVMKSVGNGEEVYYQALMLWDQPATRDQSHKTFQGKIIVPEKKGRYFIRIYEPDTVFAEALVEVK